MKKEMTSVPLIIYENEMKSKNKIITFQFIILIILLIILGLSIYLFVNFIGSYDYVNYGQDGDGINNINSYGEQGDVINESEINN